MAITTEKHFLGPCVNASRSGCSFRSHGGYRWLRVIVFAVVIMLAKMVTWLQCNTRLVLFPKIRPDYDSAPARLMALHVEISFKQRALLGAFGGIPRTGVKNMTPRDTTIGVACLPQSCLLPHANAGTPRPSPRGYEYPPRTCKRETGPPSSEPYNFKGMSTER